MREALAAEVRQHGGGAAVLHVAFEALVSVRQDAVLSCLLTLQTHPDTIPPTLPTRAQTQTFLRTYQPAAFVISPAYRNQPVHMYLRQLLQPHGYREQLVDGYVLLSAAGK